MLTHMHATLGADDDNGGRSHTICTHHCFFIATSLQSCGDGRKCVPCQDVRVGRSSGVSRLNGTECHIRIPAILDHFPAYMLHHTRQTDDTTTQS